MPVRDATARGAAISALVHSNNLTSTREFTKETPRKSYSPTTPDRRCRYLMWQKMGQDMLTRALPPQSEIQVKETAQSMYRVLN